MSEIREIDVKSGPGIYRHYENYDLNSWYLLAEYIDNAIGSYQKNRKELKQLDINYQLTVRIIRNSSNRTITIEDNAGGIADSELARAFIIGERPEDTSGANEYGVGMKLASFHFTSRWSCETKALGESVKKTVILDVDEIEASNNTVVEVIRQPEGKDKHYTIIHLEEFYDSNWPQYKSVTKIKEFLASIFRKYLVSGELDLRFEDSDIEEVINPTFPDVLVMPYVNNPDYPDGDQKEWKVDVNFEQLEIDKKITGWVGILALGQTGRKNSGIDLVRRNRVVEGDEHAWFPIEIYGAGHAEQRTRLFGELKFTGFTTNSNKSKIDWGPEDQETKEKFIEYLKDLIIRDGQSGQNREFWDQLYNYISRAKDDSNKEKYSLIKQIEEYQPEVQSRVQSDFNQYIPSSDDDLGILQQESEFLPENRLPGDLDFTFQYDEDHEWKVVITPNAGTGEGEWFIAKSVQTSMWPKEITIEWDTNHPYSKMIFRPGDDIAAYQIIAPEVFRLISIIVIAQEQLRESGTDNIGIDYFSAKLNSMLSKF